MKPIKNSVFLSVFLGALLTAGLFFIFKNSSVKKENLLKPSQLNFSQTNTLPAVNSTQGETNQKFQPKSETAELPELQQKIELLSSQDKNLWLIFDEILKSKNDNDPRLDQMLKKLSPALHAVLFEKYHSLPDEDLSAKGMISYQIARDLKTSEDADFLKKVYQEKPCLSLADCKTVGPDDAHHSTMNQTTLVLAQLEGLYALEKKLQDHTELLKDSSYRNNVVQILVQAESFPVAVVREKAQFIRAEFQL